MATDIKVFICYAREDSDIARRLYADLQHAGVSPWMDTEDLKSDQEWRGMINSVIKESSYVIALLSSRSLSKRGYVQKELKKALDVVDELPPSDIFVIPIRIDDCQPLDERLQDLHWVDLFPSYDEGLRQILRVLVQEDIHREETVGKQADAERDDQTGAPERDITAGKDYFEHIEGPAQIFTGPVYIQQGTPKPDVEKQGKTEEPTKVEEELQAEKPAEEERTTPRKARIWGKVVLGVVGLMLLVVGAVWLYQVFSPLEEWTDPIIGIEFVKIPAGCFQMGSPETEFGRNSSDEGPVHEVCVDGFWIGKYEVTQEQWEKVMGENPANFKGDTHPVEQVSWNDVQEFLRTLNEKAEKEMPRLPSEVQREYDIAQFKPQTVYSRTLNEKAEKETYRLPSEAEWEYAARAGTQTAYSFGNDVDRLNDYAWSLANSGRKTHPVGQLKPNAWGLYDMHGNVWEWCLDWYDGNYYATSPKKNPPGPDSDWARVHGNSRVYRGGDWSGVAGVCRSAMRGYVPPDHRNDGLGFRLLRTAL